MDIFYRYYGPIITGGVYHNQASGPMDLLGINFYSREQTRCILKRLCEKKLPDHQIFEAWLQKAKPYIGFYILGV